MPAVAKESADVETLQAITSLTRSVIHHTSPIVQRNPGESSGGGLRGHVCRSCGATCSYDPTGPQEGATQDPYTSTQPDSYASTGMERVADILHDAYGIDSQVKLNVFIEFS